MRWPTGAMGKAGCLDYARRRGIGRIVNGDDMVPKLRLIPHCFSHDFCDVQETLANGRA